MKRKFVISTVRIPETPSSPETVKKSAISCPLDARARAKAVLADSLMRVVISNRNEETLRKGNENEETLRKGNMNEET